MGRWIKRLLALLIIGGTSSAAYRVLKSHRDNRNSSAAWLAPEWPEFEPSVPDFSDAPDWLPSVAGECPPGYPIKANDNSQIYHVPGGRFYDRPFAERCYANEAAAERDGYRRAKS